METLGSANCVNHANAAAEWRCRDCGKHFCRECIDTIRVSGREIEICRLCRGKCEELVQAAGKDEEEVSFLTGIPSVFVFALRGSGPILIFTIALFVYIINLVGTWIGRVLPPYGVIMTLILAVFAWGYVALFLLGVITVSVKGEKELPLAPAASLPHTWSK